MSENETKEQRETLQTIQSHPTLWQPEAKEEMNNDEQSTETLKSAPEETKRDEIRERRESKDSFKSWYASITEGNKRGSSSESWSSLEAEDDSEDIEEAKSRSSYANPSATEKVRQLSGDSSNVNRDRNNLQEDRQMSGGSYLRPSKAGSSPQSQPSQNGRTRNLSFDDTTNVSDSVGAFRSDSEIPLQRMARNSLTNNSNHSQNRRMRNLSFDESVVSADSTGFFRRGSDTPFGSDIENPLSASFRTEVSSSTRITDAIPINEEEERDRVREQIEEAREEERMRSRNFVVAEAEAIGDKGEDESRCSSNRNLYIIMFVIVTSVLATGAGFFFSGDSESEPADQSPAPSIASDSSSRTNRPTGTPSEAPLDLGDPAIRRSILESLLSDYLPLKSSVVDWIADVDTWRPHHQSSNKEWIDRYALVSIYQATNGSDWTSNDGWLGPTSGCQLQWHGVKCDVDSGLVTHLDLGYNGLGNTIPTEIGLLFSMKGVILSGNRVEGELPNSFATLTALTSLLVKENFSLGGTLPSSLFSVSTLRRLSLSDTLIGGTLPTELGLWTALTALRLSRMKLTGTIPSEIASLTKARAFEVNGNYNLTGTIPTEIGLMTDVRNLLLRTNDLTGTIPTELGLMTSLTGFQFQETRLSGSLPSELGRMTSLKKIGIDSTGVGSTIPTELGQLKGLREFTASSSLLSGSIPAEICGATGLTKLNLANTPLLTGPIPATIVNCSNLNILHLYNSSLTGDIPELPESISNCRLDANCFSDVVNALAKDSCLDGEYLMDAMSYVPMPRHYMVRIILDPTNGEVSFDDENKIDENGQHLFVDGNAISDIMQDVLEIPDSVLERNHVAAKVLPVTLY